MERITKQQYFKLIKKTPKQPNKTGEHQLQNAIMGFLRYKGYYVMRNNAGAMRMTNAYGKHYMVRMSAPGTPDIMAFKKGAKLLFIEVKVEGKYPTPLQLAKMNELEEYGAQCITAWSLDDVEKATF